MNGPLLAVRAGAHGLWAPAFLSILLTLENFSARKLNCGSFRTSKAVQDQRLGVHNGFVQFLNAGKFFRQEVELRKLIGVKSCT
jgi:hypothetical protein